MRIVRITTFFIVLGAVLFGYLHSSDAAPKKIGGWAWNPIIGWIKQQDAIRVGYIDDTDPGTKKGSFGVTKADDGTLTGWSWSAKAGWICWGATCYSDPVRNEPNKFGNPDYLQVRKINESGGGKPFWENGPIAKVNADNTVDGWIKILSWKDKGWISLSKKTSGGTSDYTVTLDGVKNEFKGWAWGGSKMGWIVFSGRSLYEIKSKPPCPRGTIVCSGTDPGGTPYQACKSSCVAPETAADCVGKCGTGLTCTTDPDDGSLKRCLLSSNDRGADDLNKGKYIGRTCDPYCESNVDARDTAELKTKWKTHYIGPWLQAKGGNVSVVGGLDAAAPPPSPEKNADFLILSGKRGGVDSSINQFESACEESGLPKNTCKRFGAVSGATRVKKGVLTTLAPKRVLITVSGSGRTKGRLQTKSAALDVDAIMTESQDPSSTDRKKRYNRFGKRVEKRSTSGGTVESTVLQELSDKTKDGSIFFYDGDLTLGDQIAMSNNPWLIENKNANKTGGMTYVIRGTLTLKHSLWYVPGTVASLKQLGSVAWVVLKKDDGTGGDIVIDNCIPPTNATYFAAELSGIFFAEDEIKTGTGDVAACENNSLFRDWKQEVQRKSTALNVPITTAIAAAAAETDPVRKQELLTQLAVLQGQKRSLDSIISGMTNKSSDVALRVNGMMIAKKIEASRLYGGGDTPAELIANDGRYQVSIPPGLEDVLKHIPSFR